MQQPNLQLSLHSVVHEQKTPIDDPFTPSDVQFRRISPAFPAGASSANTPDAADGEVMRSGAGT